MDFKILGKKALVTGASRGLGRTIVKLLAGEGVSVCAVARTAGQLEPLLAEIGGREKGHRVLPLDLMNDQAVSTLDETIQSEFGSIDIVVHNLGGTLGIRDPLSAAEDFQKVWRFNLGIAIDINQRLIPGMKQNNWGRIVHVSSSSAVMADASLAYSSAKAAVNTYVKGLGREMAKYGIIVTAIMPGPFRTEGGHWDNIANHDPERYQRFTDERMAVKRLGSPEEIGSMIMVLCSECASFMAGSIVPVDGGIH